MTVGKSLHAKLYLEGVEVPFIGASITSTVGQAGIAYIDVIPHQIINDIKPRTLVHLAVKDFTNPQQPYVLAFSGEVFGINFSKTPSSRMFSISCIDNSSYWDNVLTYFFNPMQSLGKGADGIVRESHDRENATKGADGSVKVTHSNTTYYQKIINDAINAGGDLIDALADVCKDIGDVNDFYHLAEQRLRISERIISASSGDLSKTIINQQQTLDWLMGMAGQASGFSTLRMVISDLISVLFHDFTSVPFPSVVESSKVKTSLIDPKQPTTIGEYLFKPNMYMIAPPMCNVFFPDEYASFTYSRNFFSEPTRLVYKPELPTYVGAGVQGIVLPQVYEPESFNFFMKGKGTMPSEFIGTKDVQVSNEQGHVNDKEYDEAGVPRKSSNGIKREQAFMTNEEKYKGIIFSQESMVPASSQFRQFIGDAARETYSKNVAKYLFYKKRFEQRQIQITSHLKLSVVPGFTALILDDSDGEQNIVAYCSSVTHRIYCNQGGYTNVNLSYARLVTEQDAASGKSGEPLIPPWFKEDIFGKKTTPPASTDKEINAKVKGSGDQVVVPDALSDYFARLIGKQGNKSVNHYTKEKTLLGATNALLSEYRNVKKKQGSVDGFITRITHRRYVTIDQAFSWLGAKNIDNSPGFSEYSGDRLFGNTGTNDATQLKERRKIIKKYRNALKISRGFRG